MEVKFEPGDIVKFVLGGPEMVVVSASQHEMQPPTYVVCIWFDSVGACHQQRFSEDMLKHQGKNISNLK